jgi:hypothetical protein
MRKHIIINCCDGCPNLEASGKYFCNCIYEDTGEIKRIDNLNLIPEWCPLENCKE